MRSFGGRRMSAKSILSTVLLSLQLCLGFWQIGKLTPLGALIQCGRGWFFSRCRLPLGLCADYSKLKYIPAHAKLWKWVRCHVTVPPDQPTVPRQTQSIEIEKETVSYYLDVKFRLEKEGNKLYLDGRMRYYITDTIWYSLLDFAEVAPRTVFLKGYKEFWQSVATGGVMSLSEVLDSLILENHTVKILDDDLLLRVNLSISEKVLKALNLVGLSLQTRQVYWLIPTLRSFTAAVLEFSTSLRVWVYGKINLLFCQFMHAVCDRLPRVSRRQACAFGNWVENLKPSNDLKLRIVKGKMCAVIGGGAKVEREGAVPFEAGEEVEIGGSDQTPIEIKIVISCGQNDPDYEPIDIVCEFDARKGKCKLSANTLAHAALDCSRDEFVKLCKFLTCVAKNRSGSLKSCAPITKCALAGLKRLLPVMPKVGFHLSTNLNWIKPPFSESSEIA